MEEKDLEKLPLWELKNRLSNWRLPTSGNKHQLIDRLVEESKKKKQRTTRVNESDAGFFNNIPDIWIHEVLIYVTATDLGHLAQTCRRFREIAKDTTLWEEQKWKYVNICINYLQQRGPKKPFLTSLPSDDKRNNRWSRVIQSGNMKGFLHFLDTDVAFIHTSFRYGRNQQSQAPISMLLSSMYNRSLCDFLVHVGVETTGTDLAKLLSVGTWEKIHEEWYECLLLNESSLKRDRYFDANNDPLLVAISKRDLKIVKELVEKGNMDVNTQAYSSSERAYVTPLSAAAFAGKLDVVKYLLECGAKVQDEMFLSLCKKNPADVTKMIVLLHEKGGGFNVNVVDDHNRNALMFACKAGNKELVDWLLEHKADPNVKCGYGANLQAGDRSILLAINSTSVHKNEIVTALLKHGADPNVRDDYNDETPLSSTTDESLIKILEAYGAKHEEVPWKHVHVEP